MTIKLRSVTNIAGLAIVLIAALVLSAFATDDEAAGNTSKVASQPSSNDTAAAEPEPTATPRNQRQSQRKSRRQNRLKSPLYQPKNLSPVRWKSRFSGNWSNRFER